MPNYKMNILYQNNGQIKSKRTTVNMSSPSANEKRLKTFHVVGNGLKKCWTTNGRIKFIITAFGIFGSFFCVGIFQETIMRGCYGNDTSENCKYGERFKYAITIVLVKCFFGLVFVQGIQKI